MEAQTARTTILSTPDFKAWLAAEAKKEGVSISQLVRQRCKPQTTDKEAQVLSALLEELKKSTKKAHESLDRGVVKLNMVLDKLEKKRMEVL